VAFRHIHICIGIVRYIFGSEQVKSLSGYRELSVENKIKVIVGLVLCCTFFFAVIILIQFGFDFSQIDKLCASGYSLFDIAKTLLQPIYLMVILPTSISASVTVACLRRRFSDVAVGLFLLSVIGLAFLLFYLLFSLCDLLFASLPIETQALLAMLAIYTTAISLGLIIKNRKIDNYIRKIFK